MPTPRMPSQSQIRSQMRAAQRKAEQQIKSEVRKVEQQFERDLKAAQRKAESDAKAQQRRNEQAAQREIDKWGQGHQPQVAVGQPPLRDVPGDGGAHLGRGRDRSRASGRCTPRAARRVPLPRLG